MKVFIRANRTPRRLALEFLPIFSNFSFLFSFGRGKGVVAGGDTVNCIGTVCLSTVK